MAGNGLPARWQSSRSFVVLDTGFASGHKFLATWQAWRADAHRCDRLVYLAIDRRALTGDVHAKVHRRAELEPLAESLRRAWPPTTPGLHRLTFDDQRVELLLAFGDLRNGLSELVAEVDAFYVDDLPEDVDNTRLCKALGRLSATGATLAAAVMTPALRDSLGSAGFQVQADQRGDEVLGTGPVARFDPRFVPRRATSRARPVDPPARRAIVIGAGLAGCATAAALAVHGWHSTVLDRQARIAAGASGNPAGLFHGIVNAHDGPHAQFNRAAALAARHAVQAALHRGVAGSASGLLRLETALDVTQMLSLLQRLGLPADWVQACSAKQASEHAGLPLLHPCWFYPGGGWVDPAGLAATFLARAGTLVELRTSTMASRLMRHPGGWHVLDAAGRTIADAATVVLANAADAARLLDASGIATDWPLESVRGQVSLAPAARLVSPRIPIAGRGYLLPAHDDRVMFGATARADDTDAAVRDGDHDTNLAQLAHLLGHRVDLSSGELTGRTEWRCSARDRLPLIGGVPDAAAVDRRLDQPRFVTRLPGLHVFTGLGSRGITWCTLGATLLASGITGSPAPVEARLRDAVDPARFVSRQARRAPPARDE